MQRGPKVFALVEGEVQVGLIASEKRAIDSSLRSLSQEFKSVPQKADVYCGGRIVPLAEKDWETILPYLRENERLFGISVDGVLLKKDGAPVRPSEIYKKVEVMPITALHQSEKIDDDTD